jgi:acyl-CoA synthetase (AMP-forming)/AMP-acid ligase II
MGTLSIITIDGLLRAQSDNGRPAVRFEDQTWTWTELLAAAVQRASLLRALLRPGPPHVGLLLDNVVEFPMWLSAAALAGAAVVGINPTRRGVELERDISHTECQVIVTEEAHLHLLDGLSTGVPGDLVLDVGSDTYASALAIHRGAEMPPTTATEASLYLLLFTSGTSGAPKACICTQGRLARIGSIMAETFALTGEDVCYQVMPMFHSNTLMAGWAPAVAGGCVSALRRRFSASGFLSDVRRYGVTYFNYVGRPLSYILATPELPDDADNPLRIVFGNEAAEHDVERFAKRFGCAVFDNYGSTEGGVSVSRTPDVPPGALGRAAEGTVVLDPETGDECPPARFDADGVVVNADEAIGELANRLGTSMFEGYWKNEEAQRARVHDGVYWTGDLAYRDAEGFVYFAGRDFDWLRVDGENFAAAPVERVIGRHPDVLLVAVYAVPDPEIGDMVMAAVQLQPGRVLDLEHLETFLDDQTDMGTKWAPRLVRICDALPTTQTNKILKRRLRQEHWECADAVWWRPTKDDRFRPLTPADKSHLREVFAANGRLGLLAAS